MNDWYFLQENGKTVGPLNVDDIRTRIVDGRIRVFDLIYKDGDESWRLALEHAKFRGEFKTSTLATLKERPWICLKRKGELASAFVTNGPLSFDEIRASLRSGQLSYSDYAWKEGFPEWRRIGGLEEFNPRVRHEITSTSSSINFGPDTTADGVNDVVEAKKPNRARGEGPPPLEADSEDLRMVQESDQPPPLTVRVVSAGTPVQSVKSPTPPPPIPTPIIVPIAEMETRRHRRRRKVSQSWVDWGLVGGLVLVLVGVVYVVSRLIKPHAPPPPPSEVAGQITDVPAPKTAPISVAPPAGDEVNIPAPPAQTDAPSLDEHKPVVREPVVVAKQAKPPPPPPPPPPREPTELILSVRSVSVNQARIEIRTDSSPNYPVYLQVVSLQGQVSEGAAFYRFLKYIPSGDAQKPLDLSNLSLPQGRFILRAETGDLKKEQRLNLGVTDPLFKQSLPHLHKMWAYVLWRERLRIFKLTQTLEVQLTQGMVPGKRFSTRGLDPLLAVKRVNGGNYLLFDDWWELHQIVKDARGGVNPTLLSRAQRVRDHIATFSVWK